MGENNIKYRIGCPIWSCPHWRGSVYKPKSPRANWLKEYSQVFSTVEGNSTFYGIPKPDTFKRWADETADGFRFALKFPRAISHEKELLDAETETAAFLDGLAVLHEADRLGPSFIQLSPTFAPTKFGQLKNYIEQLPVQFPFAVEVRHPDFFETPVEDELNGLLSELSIDRVIFDSRPLFSKPPSDEIEEASQKRKPRVPIRTNVTGRRPILRLVGRNDLSVAQPWVEEWSQQVAEWIDQGLEPYVFAHTPDDRAAPEFAQLFHESIKQLVEVSPLCFGNKSRQFQRMLF